VKAWEKAHPPLESGWEKPFTSVAEDAEEDLTM